MLYFYKKGKFVELENIKLTDYQKKIFQDIDAYMAERFGRGTAVRAQNDSSNKTRENANLVRMKGFCPQDLFWVMNRGFKAFLISHRLKKNKRAKKWLDGEHTSEIVEGKEYDLYVLQP